VCCKAEKKVLAPIFLKWTFCDRCDFFLWKLFSRRWAATAGTPRPRWPRRPRPLLRPWQSLSAVETVHRFEPRVLPMHCKSRVALNAVLSWFMTRLHTNILSTNIMSTNILSTKILSTQIFFNGHLVHQNFVYWQSVYQHVIYLRSFCLPTFCVPKFCLPTLSLRAFFDILSMYVSTFFLR
jgi:hypothetical protein